MSIINRTAIAVSALALAAAPAAFAKGGPPSNPGGDHGNGGNPPAAQHGKGHAKPKKVVAKGTVVSYDATTGTLVVHVGRASHPGKSMVGTDVSFDVSKARITAADSNNDGKIDASDLAVGDKVVVQTTNVAGTDGRYTAKHVVDQTHPKSSDSSGSTDSTDSTDQQTTQS